MTWIVLTQYGPAEMNGPPPPEGVRAEYAERYWNLAEERARQPTPRLARCEACESRPCDGRAAGCFSRPSCPFDDMTAEVAELVLTAPDGGAPAADYYEALAFLLAERAPA